MLVLKSALEPATGAPLPDDLIAKMVALKHVAELAAGLRDQGRVRGDTVGEAHRRGLLPVEGAAGHHVEQARPRADRLGEHGNSRSCLQRYHGEDACREQHI